MLCLVWTGVACLGLLTDILCRHLPKCFDNVHNLEFKKDEAGDPTKTAIGMYSGKQRKERSDRALWIDCTRVQAHLLFGSICYVHGLCMYQQCANQPYFTSFLP